MSNDLLKHQENVTTINWAIVQIVILKGNRIQSLFFVEKSTLYAKITVYLHRILFQNSVLTIIQVFYFHSHCNVTITDQCIM